MRLSDFDYELPPELIAQEPAPRRDASRLLALERATGVLSHRRFGDLPDLLRAGDVLVINDTRVLPARLFGAYEDGRPVEALFLHPVSDGSWEALVKPAKHARPGRQLALAGGRLQATVVGLGTYGRRRLQLPPGTDLRALLKACGAMPLPPYIKRQIEGRAPSAERSPDDPAPGSPGARPDGSRAPLGPRLSALDSDRYQTVYAREEGAVAAPTAGLHFTPELLSRLQSSGILLAPITLHVGPGTFQPVRVDDIRLHRMEPERFRIPEASAAAVRAAKQEGRRVVAVGTTCVRTLEHLAAHHGEVSAAEGWADLFIAPGHVFRVVDALLTNFHLPRSTLLMLVSAFAGRETIRRAYLEAIRERYRFYSYGDAMLMQ
ncbi:MAG: S-adenosylmethionine:tRNA ribosyltransferase-isomerase [Candidatus Methylomirabilota bacterium]